MLNERVEDGLVLNAGWKWKVLDLGALYVFVRLLLQGMRCDR